MKVLRLIGFCVLLCLLPGNLAAEAGSVRVGIVADEDQPAPALSLLLAGLPQPGKSNKPVALVYALAGEAALMVPSEQSRPLRLYDRLPVGATLKVGPGSRLALAFANGRRYLLDAYSQATLGSEDLLSLSGHVRPLPMIPHLPCLLPIARQDRPGLLSGAVRIRSESVFSRRRRPLVPVEGDRPFRLSYLQSP